MAWAEPDYTREKVNGAAKTINEIFEKYGEELVWSDGEERLFDRSIMIVNNWRACHGYPLNIFQNNMRRSAKKLDGTALIAQRTKRLRSIAAKLERQPTMKLTQMQDIGGCPADVKNVVALSPLGECFTKKNKIKPRP